MSGYLYVEISFLDQLEALGWMTIDQGQGMIPSNPAKSLHSGFRERILRGLDSIRCTTNA